MLNYQKIKNFSIKNKVALINSFSFFIIELLSLFFSLSAVSRIPSFKLSDIATNLLIITQSKTGKVEGKKQHTHAQECFIQKKHTHIEFMPSTADALLSLKSMMQADYVPSKFAVTRLVQALGSQGNLASIQEVEKLMKGLGTSLNLSSMLFINNTALAHIKK